MVFAKLRFVKALQNMGMVLLLSSFFLIAGVSEIGAAQLMSLMEGDSVTLHTDLTEILNDDTIIWLFGPKDSFICQIKRRADFTSQTLTDDAEFRSRVQVDQITGSLTIRNTRIRHSGQYKLRVSREVTTSKIFNVTVLVVDGEMDGVKSVSRFVKESESVTLHADGEIPKDALMLWRFGDNAVLLAKVDVEANQTSINDDERFRGRLKVDRTGSLTIPNTKTTDSGLYELQIRGIERLQRFVVSVSALPDPGISDGVKAAIFFSVFVAVVLLVGAGFAVMYHRMHKLENQIDGEKISKMEGNAVTLQTGLTNMRNEMIEWWYEVEAEDSLIAENRSGTFTTHDGSDGQFRSKLSLNKKGDLTISNSRTIHSGCYIVKISSQSNNLNRKSTNKRFIVTINVNPVIVLERDTVTLPTEDEILGDDLILWTFGAENCLVVRATLNNTSFGGRFRDRVQLDHQNGSLTITNITNIDTGLFKLQITNSEKTRFRRFSVKVSASTNNQLSESANNVRTPLMGGDDPDGVNAQQETSDL